MGFASYLEDIERDRAQNPQRTRFNSIDGIIPDVGGPPVGDWPSLLHGLDAIAAELERAQRTEDRAELNQIRMTLIALVSRINYPCSFKIQNLDWVARALSLLDPLVRAEISSVQRVASILNEISEKRRHLQRAWDRFEHSYRSAGGSPVRGNVADLTRLDLTEQQLRAGAGSGLRRVVGGAGTGKTLILLHRALDLALSSEERVFVFTPTHTLAIALQRLASGILQNAPLPRNLRFFATYRYAAEVVAELKLSALKGLDFAQSTRLRSDRSGSDEEWRDFKGTRGWKDTSSNRAVAIFTQQHFGELLDDGVTVGSSPDAFLREELAFIRSLRPKRDLLRTYLECKRTGRGRALQRDQRELCWRVLIEWESYLRDGGLIEPETLVQLAAGLLEDEGAPSKVSDELRPHHIMVDEYQDMSTAELYVIWRNWRVQKEPGLLFLTGDFLQGTRVRHIHYRDVDESFSFSGRSHRLHLVLRCTEEIRAICRAVVLPYRSILEETGNWDDDLSQLFEESRSPYHGSPPELHVFPNTLEQARHLLAALTGSLGLDRRVGIGCPTRTRRDELLGFLRSNGVEAEVLLKDYELALRPDAPGYPRACSLGTFADLKGQEFDEVFLFDVSSDDNPEVAGDEGMWRSLLLLYVAMTRARERLTLTCTGSAPSLLTNVLPPIFHDLGAPP